MHVNTFERAVEWIMSKKRETKLCIRKTPYRYLYIWNTSLAESKLFYNAFIARTLTCKKVTRNNNVKKLCSSKHDPNLRSKTQFTYMVEHSQKGDPKAQETLKARSKGTLRPPE